MFVGRDVKYKRTRNQNQQGGGLNCFIANFGWATISEHRVGRGGEGGRRPRGQATAAVAATAASTASLGAAELFGQVSETFVLEGRRGEVVPGAETPLRHADGRVPSQDGFSRGSPRRFGELLSYCAPFDYGRFGDF